MGVSIVTPEEAKMLAEQRDVQMGPEKAALTFHVYLQPWVNRSVKEPDRSEILRRMAKCPHWQLATDLVYALVDAGKVVHAHDANFGKRLHTCSSLPAVFVDHTELGTILTHRTNDDDPSTVDPAVLLAEGGALSDAVVAAAEASARERKAQEAAKQERYLRVRAAGIRMHKAIEGETELSPAQMRLFCKLSMRQMLNKPVDDLCDEADRLFPSEGGTS